ncbi:MAG: hypothetical protein ACJ740_09675 [Gaiellales bacterium]
MDDATGPGAFEAAFFLLDLACGAEDDGDLATAKVLRTRAVLQAAWASWPEPERELLG